MQGFYGSAFTNKWATGQILENGMDSGFVNAKATWAEELFGFHTDPNAIAHALKNLPEQPPTLPQFKALCRSAPKPDYVRISAPQSDRDHAKAVLEKAKFVMGESSILGEKYGWAKYLQAAYLAGVRLLPVQISMASDVLGETWERGVCTPKSA